MSNYWLRASVSRFNAIFIGVVNYLEIMPTEELKEECFALYCQRAGNFNHGQGRMFNYYTTLILGHCRTRRRQKGKI